MPQQTQTFAFTTVNTTIQHQLNNKAQVRYVNSIMEAYALWDTGATNTCISNRVVEVLKLIPTGCMNIKTPSGGKQANTYLVDIILPNNVTVKDVRVCDSEIGDQGIDVLIGMDIITLGDFAVSNFDGKTVFSFRMPSKETTNYVKQIKLENLIGPKHGQGKKKKK